MTNIKQIVELQNPSDAITFEMTDLKSAAAAVLLLGRGAYGLEDAKGETLVPIMLFGINEKWMKENGIDLDAFIPANYAPMAEFLESVCYGCAAEREAVEVACSRMETAKAAEHRAWWNDKKRSSMNNISKGALQLAAQLQRKAAGQPVPEPLAKAVPIVAVA